METVFYLDKQINRFVLFLFLCSLANPLNLKAQDCCPISLSFLNNSVAFCEEDEEVLLQPIFLWENLLAQCDWNINWFKNGTLINSLPSKYEFPTNLPSIIIKNLNPEDAGIYLVEVSHPDCDSIFRDSIQVFSSDTETIVIEEHFSNCETCFTPQITVGGFPSFSWKRNDIVESTDLVFCTNQPGNYVFEFNTSGTCMVQEEVLVVALVEPEITFEEPNLSFCKGASAILSATVNNGDTFSWILDGEEIADTPSISATEEGTYSLFVSNSVTNCSTSASVILTEIEIPTLADQSLTLKSGEQEMLDFDIDPPVNLISNFIEAVNTNTDNVLTINSDNTIIIAPILESDRSTGIIRYQIQAVREECDGNPATIDIRVLPDIEGPFIPEIFSPNGDGVNDLWSVTFPNAEDAAQHRLIIFNRSGGKVFEQSTMNQGWDGRNCQNGVYYYLITNTKDNSKVYKGAITILSRNN